MKKIGIIFFLISVLLTQFGIAQSEIDKLIAKAQAGDPKAQNQLGVRYLIGDGVEKDPKQAVEWYRKAARAGYADALFNLGTAYYNGDGVGVDDRIALAFFWVAAEFGSSSGKDAVARTQSELPMPEFAGGLLLAGDLLNNSSDVPHNYAAARKAYEKAASFNSSALLRLAQMELDGKDAPPDPEKAKADCLQAFQSHNPGGGYCLGILYESGKLGAPDYAAARDAYLGAAKYGFAPAAYALGNLYAKGNGVPADPITAFSWYYIAAKGDARAKIALKDLTPKLSGADQSKGAKIAEKFLNDNHVFTLRER